MSLPVFECPRAGSAVASEKPLVRHDFRLVPPAVTLWLAALLGLLWNWRAAAAVGAAAVLVGAVLMVLRRPADRRRRAGVVALLGCGALVLVPLCPRLSGAEHDPLRTEAAHGGEFTARVAVTERPRPVRAAGYADKQAGARSVLVAVDVEALTSEGREIRSDGRMLLIAPAPDWSALLPGQRVSVRGSLAPARPHQLVVAVGYPRGPPGEPTSASWWQRSADAMRSELRAVAGVLHEEAAGLLPGLVVGDTTGLPARVADEFRDAGLAHLTAVSGTNVAILCGAVLLLLRALRAGPRFSAVAAGGALAGFVVLAGPEPSVLRAAVMGGVGLLALALGRKASALPALATAVIGLLLYDPAMAVRPGFALSVLATAGLVLLAPTMASALRRRGVPGGFAEGLAVPFAAFAVTAPVIVGISGRLSLVTVLANVAAAPVVAPVTVLGVLAAALAPLWRPGAEVLVHVAGPGVDWLILVGRKAAAVPGAVIGLPGGWWGGALVAIVTTVLLLALRGRKPRLIVAVLLALVLLVFLPVRVAVDRGWPPRGWTMVACDVGQGDAAVLATAEPGRAVVVDTGPEPGPVSTCLDRLGVDRVPLVVLTHLHADHLGGLSSVFEGRSVGAIAVGPGRTPDWAWRQVQAEAGRQAVPLVRLAAGDALDWPGLAIRVLGPRYVPPPSPGNDRDGTAINDLSLVLRATTAAGAILLTGDAELAAQADLLASGEDLRADVLKVPHHGSRYSLPDFFAAVRPRVAVLSVGARNRYGHPNPTTMDLLTGQGATLARTDTGGDSAVVTDHDGLAIVRRGEPRGPPR